MVLFLKSVPKLSCMALQRLKYLLIFLCISHQHSTDRDCFCKCKWNWFHFAPAGLEVLHLWFFALYIFQGENTNKHIGLLSCCLTYFCLVKTHARMTVHTAYICVNKISLLTFRGLRHRYGPCTSCDLMCFLDWQLWDITVTIKKKMKWQEHPLVCMHAQEWTTPSLHVRVFHTHMGTKHDLLGKFIAMQEQRCATVQKAAKTVMDV